MQRQGADGAQHRRHQRVSVVRLEVEAQHSRVLRAGPPLARRQPGGGDAHSGGAGGEAPESVEQLAAILAALGVDEQALQGSVGGGAAGGGVQSVRGPRECERAANDDNGEDGGAEEGDAGAEEGRAEEWGPGPGGGEEGGEQGGGGGAQHQDV